MTDPLAGAAVIFDLDGTLIDTAGDLAASMNHVLRTNGLTALPPAEVRHLVGHGARAMLVAGFDAAGAPPPSEAEMNAHVEAFLEHYLAHIADLSRPFPGATAALDRLRARGATLAICTNKREGPARMLMTALGLADRFVAIVGGDTAGAAKPDPAPVRLCLERAGTARAVFVGDSDTDIRAAAATGLPCLLATFGYGPASLADHASAAFDNFDELDLCAASALERIAGENGR